MATTAHHTAERNHSEYEHCTTFRVSNYLTKKNKTRLNDRQNTPYYTENIQVPQATWPK